MVYDRTDLARRLAANEWLQVGAIATLAGVSRGTVNAWIASGKASMRHTVSLGGQRKFHPDDVRALIADVGKVHGEQAQPTDPTP